MSKRKSANSKGKPGASRSRAKPAARPEAAKVESKVATEAATLAAGAPGPRMLQVLQAQIQPWRRDALSDEEAQLRELKRIPVRHVFDNEEARRRLVGRAVSPGKKRFSKPKAPSSS